MAIQATSPIVYNYGTYQNPYFRLVPRLAADGITIPVDCFMYPSKEAYLEGTYHLACIPVYISVSDETTNTAEGIVNKYLLYVSEQVVIKLQELYPESSFEIVEIPEEKLATKKSKSQSK
jgi:hypothetical protein